MEDPATPAVPAPETNPEARTMGMLCHLLALSGYAIPLGWVLGPLIIWLMKKDQHPFVDDQGKQAINFQITMALAMIVSGLLIFVLIGILLLPALAIFDIVLTIMAAVAANNGTWYRYPFALRFVK